MTKEHAEHIASLVPGAKMWLHFGHTIIEVWVAAFLIRVSSESGIQLVNTGTYPISSTVTELLHFKVATLESAIAASVAAGFPDLRNGKD